MIVALTLQAAVSLFVFVFSAVILSVIGFLFLVPVASAFLVREELFEWVTHRPLQVALLTGGPLLLLLGIWPAWRKLQLFRAELRRGDVAADAHPRVTETVQALARQADVPVPEVRITETDRPESYTFGGRSSGTIVVSQGLVAALSEAELEAVLAHELSHLLNGDSRVMGVAVVPSFVAETIVSGTPTGPTLMVIGPLVVIVADVLGIVSQLAVAILSRSRELAADRGAAVLTGNPTALASALETLAELDEQVDSKRRPDEDIRAHEIAAGSLNILPRKRSLASAGPFRTHPSTAERVKRLRGLAAEMES